MRTPESVPILPWLVMVPVMLQVDATLVLETKSMRMVRFEFRYSNAGSRGDR